MWAQGTAGQADRLPWSHEQSAPLGQRKFQVVQQVHMTAKDEEKKLTTRSWSGRFRLQETCEDHVFGRLVKDKLKFVKVALPESARRDHDRVENRIIEGAHREHEL